MGIRSPEALVEPGLLRWARETAHLDVVSAAKKLDVTPDRVTEWEDGTSRPSVVQLDKISDVYHRPIGMLYLRRPPTEPAAPADFRKKSTGTISPELALQLRGARERRKIALELAEVRPAPFDLRASLEEEPEDIARRARHALGITLATQQDLTSLNRWKDTIERADVLVFETLGVKSTETRGFAIYEPTLPVIVLNGAESDTGRLFTLGHELAHLMLGTTGLCGHEATPTGTEKFCDRVSGALLMPRDLLLAEFRRTAPDPLRRALTKLHRTFAVSEEAALLRLRDLGAVKPEVAAPIIEEFERLLAGRKEAREDSTKIPYFRRLLKRHGTRFTREVVGALERNSITFLDASKYLGASTEHVQKLIEHAWAPR